MNLYLYRKDHTPLFTMGRIYDGVEFLCSTLEDPVRELIDLNDDGDFNDPGEGKIYGQTAIPAASKVVSGPITYGDQIYNYPTISPNQWMSVSLSGASGHTDVAVQFYGKYM